MSQQLSGALEVANLRILKVDPTKQRPISTSEGTMNIEKFSKLLIQRLGPKAVKYPDVYEAMCDSGKALEALTDYADENDILVKKGKVQMEIPKDMQNLTLNLNLASKGRDEKFFLTHPDETVSRVTGEIYLMVHQISPLEATAAARKVIPDYMPRGKRGVTEMDNNGKHETIFNVYTPPAWMDMEGWDDLDDSDLPLLFKKLVRHLFPIKKERFYFYDWLHESLFTRSYVFLVLCSAPGTGKNRLKLVMRALHGHVNTTDGKKSTLVERFNSQLSESTLAWFDELHYDAEMENVMKELQNDSISIERKGVDATRGTKIHSSIVISNNKPRDNYIAFDARKFVPLVVNPARLEVSMHPDEIDELTKKVEDPTSDTFDVAFLGQIAKWLKKRGNSKKYPNLEYRGPMFWTLAHTSMARWQKKAVTLILEPEGRNANAGFDATIGGYLWSAVQQKAIRKNGDRSLQFPDFTSVRAFFEIFRDGKGRKAFETVPVKGNNLLGDFYVKPLIKNTEIVTEASVLEQREKQNANKPKEDYGDL